MHLIRVTMGNTRHVFFDLDGTLIDHFEAIHQSFSYAAEQVGEEVPDYKKVVATVGGSVPVTASRLFPQADVESVVKHYEKRFDEVIYDGVKINPGAKWILEELHKLGLHLYVFTNKEGIKARQTCDYLGLTKYLKKIIGTGDSPLPHRKPQREFSEFALTTAQACPNESCLVGDSPFDEASAHVVGMKCHLVATGTHDTGTLKKETKSDIYDSLFTLGQHVFQLTVP